MLDFYERVYEIVALIPYGRVTTYGAIAKCLGAARSSRLVGIAMNHSHLTHPHLPAHRVVNRNGLLTGKHHFPSAPMAELLEAEGVVVVGDCVVDFDRLFWDPKEHL
nr:MGMT family protein [Pedobacter agri]